MGQREDVERSLQRQEGHEAREVYNAETVRRYAITVQVRRAQKKKRLSGIVPYAEQTADGWRVRMSSYITAERRYYVDMGPDLETLAVVEHAFTCVGRSAGCEVCHERDRSAGTGEQLELAEAA